mmetsp:Transcript_27889/g.43851  ORF Transcript_27889/g.43851 Transcript_27889/m.43851 type:complete len:725 (-) Transcript_27889:241-2415(-)
MTDFDRINPLFERTCVPFEIFQSSSNKSENNKTNGNFTVRILQGHRPQRNGNGRERVIRFELSDECNLSGVVDERNSSFEFGHRTPSNRGVNRTTPVIHAPFMTADRGSQQQNYGDSFRLETKPITSIPYRPIELFELEVGESDFADLRRDQALLVDFSDFANSLISLLQCCELGDHQSVDVEQQQHQQYQEQNAFNHSVADTAYQPYGQHNGHSNESSQWGGRRNYTPWTTPSQGQPHPMYSQHQAMQYQRSPSPFDKMSSAMPVSTYTCRLEAEYNPASSDEDVQWRSGQTSSINTRSSHNARFSIVESNQFRELTHLALNLKTGTDKSVRLYLSSRLCQTMMQVESVQSLYQDQQRRCETAETNLIGLNKRVQELSHSSEAEKRHIQYQSEERLHAESNSRVAEVNEIKAVKDKEIQELNEQAQRNKALLENKIRVLEDINKKINDQKLTGENEIERLSTKLSIQEASNKSMTNELSTLHVQIEDLRNEKATTERSFHQIQLQLASLEHSNSSQEKTITQTEAERESAETISANAKETLSRQHMQMEDLRRRLSQAELEVSQYKDLTSRYQTNRLEMKKKMKEKVELLREQEKKLTSTEREANELKRNVDRLGKDLSSVEQKMQGMEHELNGARRKMEEDKKKLENNQQVIAWLNKQTSSSSGAVLAVNTPAVGHTSSSSSLSRYLPSLPRQIDPKQSMITPDPSHLHPKPTPFLSRRPHG